MDTIQRELREQMDVLREEIRVTDSNRTRKEYAHLMYTYGLYQLEKSKDQFRAVASVIQKWYDPADPKKMQALRTGKKFARRLFKLIMEQQANLEQFSDDMDNKIFTLED